MNRLWGVLFLFLAGTANAGLRYTQEVKVVDPSHRYLRALSKHPELIVDHPDHVGYEVYGPSGLQEWLRQHQIQFVSLQKTTAQQAAGYPTAEATIQKMQQLQQRFPTLIT